MKYEPPKYLPRGLWWCNEPGCPYFALTGFAWCVQHVPEERKQLMSNAEWWVRLHEPCPLEVGTRIELEWMPADPDPIPKGTQGTVRGGSAAQIDVEWDNGRSLFLIPGTDRWKVVGP